ncbi:DNA glycosylase [Lipomyces arxii]|uniref:DNA glycosylase n=1 Tax=Lipomyces arxii TaxID=56418 RepID=UPI0034CE6B5D
MGKMVWAHLAVPVKEVSLDVILPSGQAFRWKKHHDEWVSVLKDLVIVLRQDDNQISYRALASNNLPVPDSILEPVLSDYFNLSIKLSRLYREFGVRDSYFKKISPSYTGIRILRQDPWETLVTFICSSNNNIKRITQMIDNLCRTYGEYITTYNNIEYYTFPRPVSLCTSTCVQTLRDLGFGYRAAYIYKTALQVNEWESAGNSLSQLRGQPYEQVREFLLGFKGVGPKVADCVSLMAFDCHSCVPIDTHIWNIVQKRYATTAQLRASAKSKTMSKIMYDTLSQHLRKLWGHYAGWAQAVIFISELRKNE